MTPGLYYAHTRRSNKDTDCVILLIARLEKIPLTSKYFYGASRYLFLMPGTGRPQIGIFYDDELTVVE